MINLYDTFLFPKENDLIKKLLNDAQNNNDNWMRKRILCSPEKKYQ